MRLEPVVLLLCAMVLVFSCFLLGCAIYLKEDGQTFQVFSGVLGGFVGALLMRIKGNADHPSPSTTATAEDGGKKLAVTIDPPPVA